MPKKSDPSKHNATCFSCGTNFVYQYYTETGQDRRGEWNEGHKCSVCRRANVESQDDRMTRYTWASIKEIDASWGNVKRGELWETAVANFAKSIPVSEEKQQRLFEALL